MSQRQRPQTQVRGRVRHRPQHELDCLDHLVDESLSEGVRVLFLAEVFNLLVDRLQVGLALLDLQLRRAAVSLDAVVLRQLYLVSFDLFFVRGLSEEARLCEEHNWDHNQ